MGVKISIQMGDITEFDGCAIVNAANSSLMHGGGVAAAISKKGGSAIDEESRKIGHCPLGSAVATSGGALKARYVIHTVGPRFGVDPDPAENLRSAVLSSLKLAEELKLTSVMMPAISCGIFGYPPADAAKIILQTAAEFKDAKSLEHLFICLNDETMYKVFKDAWIDIEGGL